MVRVNSVLLEKKVHNLSIRIELYQSVDITGSAPLYQPEKFDGIIGIMCWSACSGVDSWSANARPRQDKGKSPRVAIAEIPSLVTWRYPEMS